MSDEFESGKILPRDPRIGKRVLYVAKLPGETLYGTVQSVARFSYGDVLLVQLGPGRHVNEEASKFALLEKNTPEWLPGDKVRYNRDKGDFLLGTVLRATYSNGDIGTRVQFDDGQMTLLPTALKKRT